MSRVNAHVATELAHLAAEWEAGMVEGYDANANRMPAFCFDRPYANLTARQRGYVFGRELRIQEGTEESGKLRNGCTRPTTVLG
ncbi:MAG: hypothetical protein IT328_04480 [Caldilineaceae bacterium]|nr:hypothetical protein [Caldilineaceae bacterium]